MAQKHVALPMIGHRQVAEFAIHYGTTARAMDVSREAAAIEEQNHLATQPQGVAHRALQSLAEGVETSTSRSFMTQVDNRHLRQGPFENAAGQTEQGVLATFGVVPAFQRRRRRA